MITLTRSQPSQAFDSLLARASRVVPWVSLIVVTLAYLLSTCRTVYNLDSAEFTVAVETLGITRATGYPLYLILGRLWSWLLSPFAADAGFRLNLFSAACALTTVVLVYKLARRIAGGRAASLAAAGLLAFGYYFWAQAVAAEVYTLHTALMAMLLWLLWGWAESSKTRRTLDAPRLTTGLLTFALLYGLSFGNHMASILLMPGFLLFIGLILYASRFTSGQGQALPLRPIHHVSRLTPCRTRLGRGKPCPYGQQFTLYVSRLTFSFLLPLALAFALGLTVYLYLPLRYAARPAFNYAGVYDSLGHFNAVDLSQARGVWWLVTGRTFQGLMFNYSPQELIAELAHYVAQLWAGFGAIGVVAGALGMLTLVRQRPRWAVLLGSLFVVNLFFFLDYRVMDKETMYLPTYLIWALWAATGFAALQRWVGEQARAGRSLSGLMLLAPIVMLITNFNLVNISHDTRARDYAETALQAAGREALILGWWDSAPVLQYQKLVEGERPDIQIINRFLISEPDLDSLLRRAVPQRPVYLTAPDEALAAHYEITREGPLFRVRMSR